MYKEVTPTVTAMQWTGDNAQDITDALLAEISEGFYEQNVINEVGELVISLKYGMSIVVPASGWIVSAPGWGDTPRKYWATGSVMVLTDTGFHERFITV